jgi:hypothetical protein
LFAESFAEDGANTATVGFVTGIVLCLIILLRCASHVGSSRRPTTPVSSNRIAASPEPTTLAADETSTPKLSPEATDPIEKNLNLAPKKKKIRSNNGVRLLVDPAQKCPDGGKRSVKCG